MSHFSLSGLSEPQRAAASTINGPVLILAGAGSGKTRTVTYRMAHMVLNEKIPSSSILAVTFTNKAAKEMKERVIGLLGKRKGRGLTVSTFHSLCVRILKEEIHHLGYSNRFSIYDGGDQVAIVREALTYYHAGKKFDKKMILGRIGFLKNNGILPEDYIQSPFFNEEDEYDLAVETVYRFYQERLKFCNAIDFDDLLLLTVHLLDKHPEIARKYSEKYQYIMVDEYQDTNPLQFSLVQALTSAHHNICVVGDDDQSIYAFRGADIRNILEFENHYKGTRVIKLEQNYRSTKKIIDLANEVIKLSAGRKEKTMFSTNDTGPKPYLWRTGDTDHEAGVVVDDIIAYQKDGGSLADVAILYRSNTQIIPFEDALRLSMVPYRIIGGQKLYDKKEIKDLIAYLSVIHNPKDELSLRRILNVPNRGIGPVTLESHLEIAKVNECSLFEAFELAAQSGEKVAHGGADFVKTIRKYQQKFQEHTLAEALSTLIEEIEYYAYLEKNYDHPKMLEKKRSDVQYFIESAERFTRFRGKFATLEEFIEKLLLADSQNEEKDDEDPDVRRNEVTLMTLHSSKGLEFEVVYFVGMEEEMIPHKKTITEGGDINEERRLCYVGITRAKEKLVMTYCQQRKIYGKDTPRHKSRFVQELEALYEEQDRNALGHLTDEEADEYIADVFSGLISSLED